MNTIVIDGVIKEIYPAKSTVNFTITENGNDYMCNAKSEDFDQFKILQDGDLLQVRGILDKNPFGMIFINVISITRGRINTI